MTNVSASKTEGYTIRNTYTNMGLLSSDSKIKFKIPVYKNMPEQICPEPGTEKTVTQDVEITENNVRVRKGKGTNYDIITTLDKGTKLLRIELDNSKTGGYYWDKVVLSDGTKGYIARDYLIQIDLQSNCNEKYITTKYTDFRNGPGTSKTTVLKVLPAGQIVTIVEKDKYKSIDDNDWCRIKLSDGTYGYVTANSFEEYDPTKVDQLKIICTDGLTIRSSPSTSSSALGTLYKGAVVTRIEKNVESSNTNYVWDKIITSSGITGYIATRDIKNNEDWAEIINSDDRTDTPTDTTIEIKGSGFKTSDANIVCQPKITVANIKAVSEDIIIKKGDTIIENATSVGTGYTLTLKDKTYTIVVLGDVNGDNEINSADLLTIVKYLKGTLKITQEYEIKSADVNKDGEINSADLLCIVKYLKGSIKIEV